MTVALADYGAGNVTSVVKALGAVGADVRILTNPDGLTGTHALVIPGVGHFEATAALGDDWRQAVRERIDAAVPVLGICLGMQWLFEGSDEAADCSGLGVFPGRCIRITGDVKVPHVGWNTLDLTGGSSQSLAGIHDGAWAYFTHSYAAPVVGGAIATTTYGAAFASCVERGAVWGTQWHPEKSGETGLRLLRNFMELVHAR